MTRTQMFSPWRVAAVAACGLLAFAAVTPARAADLDPSQMSADAIKALQQRLTDAGCYKGTIDGTSSATLDAAIKACPDQRPFLSIETGMHTALIRSVGVDAACRLLATASEDRTVRLWSLPDGVLKRVVRLPIGDGNAGKVYATALSPDGRWLAVGGYDATWDQKQKASLTIVDLSNGAIRRFGAFDQVIHRVAFSADGRRVAVGLDGSHGLRVLDSASGAELFADRDYGDRILGLAFAPDGGLITSSFDGQLRRYRPDFKLTIKRPAPDGKLPNGVAIDPSGRRVAVGYTDETPVSILDAMTLVPLTRAQTSDLSDGDLGRVAWSSDGARLIAGGSAAAVFNGEWWDFLRRFDATGRSRSADVAVSSDRIMDIQPCGQGFVFATADPAFGLFSAQGVATQLQGPRRADMRDKLGSALAVSSDASSVRFGLRDREQEPVAFDLAAAALKDSPSLLPGFALTQVDGLPVTDWENNYAPKFRGEKLTLLDHEQSRAMAILPDVSGFALGTEWNVRAFDAKGNGRWNHASPGGPAWGVDFSADGEILVVAYGDGTIRWLRWTDGEELLAFFVEPQTRKWVAWTPSGYYMASAGGEDLIGWHVNRGWDQEADFFPASQFRAQYNRPDIVRLVLQTRDEAEAVRRANTATDRSVEAKPVSAALPPVVSILSPANGFHFSGESIEISYGLRSPSALLIDRLEVLADGQHVEATGFEKTSLPEAKGRVAVTLPKRDTTVSLIAHSGDLTSAPISVKLVYEGSSTADLLKPKLYALLVGVTGYQNPEYDDLQFPAHDAESLATALEGQKGGLYADVQIKVVDDATQHNVFEGLDWLRHSATSRDLAIVFLSGHGFVDGKQKFWFLTREADLDRLRSTAISNDDLLDSITSVPGKKILFIDACHAGAAMSLALRAPDTSPDMNKVVNDFSTAGSGVVVYGASTGTERAKEDAKWDRHGAFTKALIEAIGEGKAKMDPSGRITTDILDFYVEERVKDLTGGAQHPVMNRPALIPDFPLALARP
jgi:Caspase domain/WD domain, G-beta repeat